MLNDGFVFLIVSLALVLLGFTAMALSVGEVVRAVFLVFMVLFLVSLIVKLVGYTSLDKFIP